MVTQILVVGEKPSQCKKFRDALLTNVQSVKQAKYIYSYEGQWQGSQGTYKVTIIPLAGHITRIDTPEEFGWGKVPPLEIVTNPQALVTREDPTYRKVLRQYAPQADELYIATDPDSEGDNIGYEAYQIVVRANPSLRTNVKRVWNSSLTNTEIRRAFQQTEANPPGWDTNLALSVQGRQMTDAWLGFAGTREVTQAARQVVRIKVFSVGRVQLPTLKMVVERDLEHESFVPQPLWNIQATLKAPNGQEEFQANHASNPFKEEDKATKVRRGLDGAVHATVQQVDRKQVRRLPPAPLNTTAALSLLARLFKLKAERALELLSDLYLEGLLSYPRTENARFSDTFPHQTILDKLATDGRYQPLVAKVRSKSQVRTNGKKKGVEDHDPIHPTGEFPTGGTKLTQLHIDVLHTLSLYYVGMFMDDLVTAKAVAQLTIKAEPFVAEGSTIVDEGWVEAIHWQRPKDTLLPPLNPNELAPVVTIRKTKSATKPRPRWSDSTILKQMERLGLGTKSSRPSILEKLVERGYVARDRHQIISQPSGRALVGVLGPIWPDIVTNAFTKTVESKMDEVARGTKPYPTLLDELRQYYVQAHTLLLTNLPKFQQALRSIDPSLLTGDAKGKGKGKGTGRTKGKGQGRKNPSGGPTKPTGPSTSPPPRSSPKPSSPTSSGSSPPPTDPNTPLPHSGWSGGRVVVKKERKGKWFVYTLVDEASQPVNPGLETFKSALLDRGFRGIFVRDNVVGHRADYEPPQALAFYKHLKRWVGPPPT